jgi:hypothetical protein
MGGTLWAGVTANEAQLAVLRDGLDGWNGWRRENPSAAPELSKAILIAAGLREANLSRANLTGRICARRICAMPIFARP